MKKIRLILMMIVLIITLTSNALACGISSPARIDFEGIYIKDNTFEIGTAEPVTITNSYLFIYSRYNSDKANKVNFFIKDELVLSKTVTSQTELLRNDLANIFYDENYDWTTGDSIRKYDGSIMRIMFDDELVGEFKLIFREPVIHKCPATFGYGGLVIAGLILVILITGIILLIRLIIRKVRKT